MSEIKTYFAPTASPFYGKRAASVRFFFADRYNPLHEPHWLKRALAEVVDMVDANRGTREICFSFGRISVRGTAYYVMPSDCAKTFVSFARI